jgi:TAT (twin-arginine translocation) pathway-exported protein
MLSRRDFLRSAGGVTALALRPLRHGLFAAPAAFDSPRLPLFTVVPYVFDVDGTRLTMTQVDEAGTECDRIVVTKAPPRLSSAAGQ